MFIKELDLNIDYVKEQVKSLNKIEVKQMKDAVKYINNLLEGIDYYRGLAVRIFSEHIAQQGFFLSILSDREEDLKQLRSEVE